MSEPLGSTFNFGYDNRFILTSISRPGFVNESLGYDAGGRLVSNGVTGPGGTLRSAGMIYDVRDKLLRTTNPAGNADTLTASYNAFGHVANGTVVSRGRTMTNQPARYTVSETVGHDAMGNQTSLQSQSSLSYPGHSSTSSKNQSYTYEHGTGRLLRAPRAG